MRSQPVVAALSGWEWRPTSISGPDQRRRQGKINLIVINENQKISDSCCDEGYQSILRPISTKALFLLTTEADQSFAVEPIW